MRLLVALTFLWTSSSFAAILTFDAGVVTGVNNVQVGGQTFRVEFMDGVFLDLYPDGINPIFFQDISNVIEAANQIGEAFSSDLRFNDADQIFGCESAPLAPLGHCGILFPFDVEGEEAINALYAIGDTGGVGFSALDAGATETQAGAGLGEDLDNLVFAVVTPVPIPSAIWLFGSGLLGLVGIARRKKA